MSTSQKILIWIGVLAYLAAFLGQLGTDYWCSQHYPGYDWMAQSLSYQGQVGSPVKELVTAWGVLFSILFIPFSIGFYTAFASLGKWVKWAAIMILIYGLGEGAGSGLIPVEASSDGMTGGTLLHIVLSMIGDAGLFLLPLVMVRIFPKQDYPRFFMYSWLVLVSGFSFAILFTLTKMYHSDTGIMHYRGVWQRAYTFIFHVYLLFITYKMVQSLKKGKA